MRAKTKYSLYAIAVVVFLLPAFERMYFENGENYVLPARDLGEVDLQAVLKLRANECKDEPPIFKPKTTSSGQEFWVIRCGNFWFAPTFTTPTNPSIFSSKPADKDGTG
jgi:hypothetical protein